MEVYGDSGDSRLSEWVRYVGVIDAATDLWINRRVLKRLAQSRAIIQEWKKLRGK